MPNIPYTDHLPAGKVDLLILVFGLLALWTGWRLRRHLAHLPYVAWLRTAYLTLLGAWALGLIHTRVPHPAAHTLHTVEHGLRLLTAGALFVWTFLITARRPDAP